MIVILGIIVVLFAVYEIWKPMTPGSIASYAANAGFSGFALVEAVAIAYAESGGDSKAVGDLSLGRSIGLWQINLRAHPEYSEESLYDPQTNANAAFAIYQDAGNSFTPWTTFNTGAYSNFLDKATQETTPDEAQISASDFSDDGAYNG